jgi:hemerythrin-like domain-containing protein
MRQHVNKKTIADFDIVDLILEDHKPLKRLLKVMKDLKKSLEERQFAFEEFAPLLVKHAKPEEQVLYVFMKRDSKLRTEGFEGDVEHVLAEQMLDEAKNTSDDELWSARVKVLAELVEHHIKEEESELLPKFQKYTTKDDRSSMGIEYLDAKENTLHDGSERTPHKSDDENSIISPLLN